MGLCNSINDHHNGNNQKHEPTPPNITANDTTEHTQSIHKEDVQKRKKLIPTGIEGYILVGIGTNKGEGAKNKKFKILNKHLTNDQHIISNVHNGLGYTVYTDDNYNNCFVEGMNLSGQCCIDEKIDRIDKCVPINYFKDNKIKLKKVCVSNSGGSTFWITRKGKVYGCGDNYFGQLGLNEYVNRYKLELIKTLNNAVNITCSGRQSYAICFGNSDEIRSIIHSWTNMDRYAIIDDIINLIIKYLNIYHRVYESIYRKSGSAEDINDKFGWKQIETLNNKDIIKVAAGREHVIFLQSNGLVYCCGSNSNGRLGISYDTRNYQKKPILIPYFNDNKVKIKDIKCGYGYNLALDVNGNVYSWGDNSSAQCGHQFFYITNDKRNNICFPKLIDFKDIMDDDEHIEIIECGNYHSYCKTNKNKHLLFGVNVSNQCMTFDDRRKIYPPYCINQIIKDVVSDKKIKSISLGTDNTTIVFM